MKTMSLRNIMKCSIVLIGVFALASCELNDSFTQAVKSGPNFVLFKDALDVQSVSHLATDKAYKVGVKMYVAGPHMKDVSGPITFSIENVTTPITSTKLKGDSAELAKLGVNFKLPNKKLTLKESNNYLGVYYFKMLTKGIEAAKLPGPKIVKLKITNVTGDESVVGSGRVFKVGLHYVCASPVAGIYTVHGLLGFVPKHQVKVTSNGCGGKSVTNSIGGWYAGSPYRTGKLAPLNYGVKFVVDAKTGTVTVTPTPLGGHYTNPVKPIGSTKVKPTTKFIKTGNFDHFILHYSIGGLGKYKVYYKKIGDIEADKASPSIVVPYKSASQAELQAHGAVSKISSLN